MNKNSEPTLQSVLPAATHDAIAKALGEDFKSTLKLPKGMNRYIIASAIDNVLLHELSVEQVKTQIGLVASEVSYVKSVIDEFRAWEAMNKGQESKP
jgi:hypothetical protein